MKIETFLFGSVEVGPEQIIEFPDGLLSFENCKRFMLIHETDAGEPASFTLQSLDDPAVAVQIVDPHAMGFTYELAFTDEETAKIKLENHNDVAVMLVVFKPEEGGNKGIGANLRAPIIINTKARLGLQKVLTHVRPNLMLSNLSSPA